MPHPPPSPRDAAELKESSTVSTMSQAAICPEVKASGPAEAGVLMARGYCQVLGFVCEALHAARWVHGV
jgi:hypothetical protein